MKTSLAIFALIAGISASELFAQPALRIKFRYFPEDVFARVSVPGSFNNWGNNTGGAIDTSDSSKADSLESASGCWVKTVLLLFGAYEYKFYRDKIPSLPVSDRWIPDPLNRNADTLDNNNSIITVDSLVLFQLCAYPYSIETRIDGKRVVCQTTEPTLSAGIYQLQDLARASISAAIDDAPIDNPLAYYDSTSGIFAYKSSLLADGMHTFKLVVTSGRVSKADSVQFEVRARPVQIQTPPFTTRKPFYVTAGILLKSDGSGLDSSVNAITLKVNGIAKTIPVRNGSFYDSTALVEGQNWIIASTASGSDSVPVTRIVDRKPWASANARLSGNAILLDASGSTNPDGQPFGSFKWSDDSSYPLGLNGRSGTSVSIVKPAAPGEYYFGLIATDREGHADTMRSYFTINGDGSLTNPTIASNPEWARNARVYFLFPKAASAGGTLSEAASRLPIIRDMGFNIVWMMPVMKNAYPINNQGGPGYNIIDFYSVAPEYGTNQDFRNFVGQAHSLGLKVILDVTPNHSSRFHPWSVDAHTNKQWSPYWNWYQHNAIVHNTNGLGQTCDADSFYYYSAFSNQLLNLNWTDIDMRSEMINVYTYWIKEFGVDGYRFDVYWGPHRRYGEQYMGEPVRDALKHIKPDILLLGEDEGTGVGTDTIYADYSSNGINGGLDAAYDFKLYFNQIRGFAFTETAINNLDAEVWNGGYYPGPNSLYMRFMESQDEDRIASVYSGAGSIDAPTTFLRTMPMASVIFTVPGIPMIWNGQEVGKGYGDGDLDSRRRGVINWNYEGRTLLQPHYQRLAQIRGQFRAFSTQQMIRLTTENGLVYTYTRPYPKEDGLVLINFGNAIANVTIPFTVSDLSGWVEEGKSYILSDLYNGGTYPVHITNGSASVNITVGGYGTAICVLSDSEKHVIIPVGVESEGKNVLPRLFRLKQNYPNPFNLSTTIEFELPVQESVNLRIYNLLGEEVSILANDVYEQGIHRMRWNGNTQQGVPASSGVYFVRLSAGAHTTTAKIVLVK